MNTSVRSILVYAIHSDSISICVVQIDPVTFSGYWFHPARLYQVTISDYPNSFAAVFLTGDTDIDINDVIISNQLKAKVVRAISRLCYDHII